MKLLKAGKTKMPKIKRATMSKKKTFKKSKKHFSVHKDSPKLKKATKRIEPVKIRRKSILNPSTLSQTEEKKGNGWNASKHKLLLAMHNHMMILKVSFEKDVTELQQMYQRKYFKPIQELRSSLLAFISDSNNKPSFEKINAKIRKTTLRGNDLRKDVRYHCRLLASAGPPEPALYFRQHFWLEVLKNSNNLIKKMIGQKEVHIFQHLEDISISDTGLPTKGFEICFQFSALNPYFENTEIIKRYLIDIFPKKHTTNKMTEAENYEKNLLEENHILGYKGPRLVEIAATKIIWKNNILNKEEDNNNNFYKSIFDYFQFSWKENTENKNQLKAEYDYSIGTYLQNVVIPNAYEIFCGINNVNSSDEDIMLTSRSSKESLAIGDNSQHNKNDSTKIIKTRIVESKKKVKTSEKTRKQNDFGDANRFGSKNKVEDRKELFKFNSSTLSRCKCDKNNSSNGNLNSYKNLLNYYKLLDILKSESESYSVRDQIEKFFKSAEDSKEKSVKGHKKKQKEQNLTEMQLVDAIVSTQQPVQSDIQTKFPLVKEDSHNDLIALLSDFFEKNSGSDTKQIILESKEDKLQKKVNSNDCKTLKIIKEINSKSEEDFTQQQTKLGGFPCQSAGQSKAVSKEYFKTKETNLKFFENNKKSIFYEEDFNSSISSSSKTSQISLLSELDISNEPNSSRWLETEFFMNPIYKSQSEPEKNGSYKKLINETLKPHQSEFHLQTYDLISTNCHQLYERPQISAAAVPTSSEPPRRSRSLANLHSKSKISKWTNILLSRFNQRQQNKKEKYNIQDNPLATEFGINRLDFDSILYPSTGFFEEKNLEVRVGIEDYANDVSVANWDHFQRQLLSSTSLHPSFQKDKNGLLQNPDSILLTPQIQPLDLRVKSRIPSTCHEQTLKRKSNSSSHQDLFSLKKGRKKTPRNEKNLSCYFGNKFVKKVAVDLDFGATCNQNLMTMNFFADSDYHQQNS